jgi:hypothetical protein
MHHFPSIAIAQNPAEIENSPIVPVVQEKVELMMIQLIQVLSSQQVFSSSLKVSFLIARQET